MLSERRIHGIGTECIDIELPWRTGNAIKQLLAARNRYSLVQLTNLQHLPAKGIVTTVAPMKLQGGAGGPARVFAQVKKAHRSAEKRKHKPKNHHKQHQRKERNNDMMESIEASSTNQNSTDKSDELFNNSAQSSKLNGDQTNVEQSDPFPEAFSTAQVITTRSQDSIEQSQTKVSMNTLYYGSGGSSYYAMTHSVLFGYYNNLFCAICIIAYYMLF